MSDVYFRYYDFFKRIVEVGWGAGIYMVLNFDGHSDTVAENTVPAIQPIEIFVTIDGGDADIPYHTAPNKPDTPQLPDFPTVPEIVYPPSPAMKAFFDYWSDEALISDEQKLEVVPGVAVIEPDIDEGVIWTGPYYQFAHSNSGAAQDYINEWRELNPGWADFGWFIHPPRQVAIGSARREVYYTTFFNINKITSNNIVRITAHLPEALALGGAINGTFWLTTLRFTETGDVLIQEDEKGIISFSPSEVRTIYDTITWEVNRTTGAITRITL